MFGIGAVTGTNGELRIWRSFVLRIILVIVITGLISSLVILVSSSNLVEESLYLRAKAHFKDIVLTRRWNANYGGVYVEKKPGIESNPYLLNPDIKSMEGKVYTKKNPALMTREISELAAKDDDYFFHITSLKLKNPNNKPDDWESKALLSFEQGKTEDLTRETIDGKVFYRYMAPLKVEKSCLTCHADQGYKVGDIRGGISVEFDTTTFDREVRANQILIIIVVVLILMIVIGGILAFVNTLYKKLTVVQNQLKELVGIDELTRIHNRRYFFEHFENEVSRSLRYHNDLCCIMIDIDRFKMVNDRYGHTIGDIVLRDLAQIFKVNIRHSDMVARYGGEEFIVMLPQSNLDDALQVAEKLRHMVETHQIETPKGLIKVTASFGVAVLNHETIDQVLDELLQRADLALYKAKSDGKNCVRS